MSKEEPVKRPVGRLIPVKRLPPVKRPQLSDEELSRLSRLIEDARKEGR